MARRNKKKKSRSNTYYYDYVSTGTVVRTTPKSRKSSHLEISDVAISVFGSSYYCVGDQCRTT